MNRSAILVYGIISYLIGLVGLVYFLLFVGGWDFLPLHIDSRTSTSWVPAVLINIGLVFLFGLQHSIMARPWFKERLAKVIPSVAERSTYVLVSGLFMIGFCLFWQPVPGTVWSVESPLLVTVLRIIHIAGWLVLIGATFEIDHLELMGLRQVWENFTGRTTPEATFSERYLYGIVRHPIQLGLLMVVWANPHMSKTLYLLAALLTVYIYIGLYFEERALLAKFGDTYYDYSRRVPMLIPFAKVFRRR
ncbi:membrane protein [Oceaniferula spumae]|uniref:Membrane protein n=1 Tax=Oceaniferula spumae TaxID=2979115 RepID=A0AAT9FMP5_9BACT